MEGLPYDGGNQTHHRLGQRRADFAERLSGLSKSAEDDSESDGEDDESEYVDAVFLAYGEVVPRRGSCASTTSDSSKTTWNNSSTLICGYESIPVVLESAADAQK